MHIKSLCALLAFATTALSMRTSRRRMVHVHTADSLILQAAVGLMMDLETSVAGVAGPWFAVRGERMLKRAIYSRRKAR